MLESKSYIATPPGATIKEQLDDRGMTQKEFAKRMGMTEKHISRLINGSVQLTPDVAERLELVLSIPASFWNNLEAIYREKMAKVKRENELSEDIVLAKQYPYKQLVKWGMVPDTNRNEERVYNLCKFFEVCRLKDVGEFVPIACRRLANTEKSTFAMWTLAQYAKRKAGAVHVEPFSRKKLLERLPAIRAMTRAHSIEFAGQLEAVLAQCGIALVYLPQIAGSFLHGITFYDNRKIVLGITMRGKYADKFWFSLFHEFAHILEGHIYQKESTSAKEEQKADSIAADILIPAAALRRFEEDKEYSIGAIRRFALRIGTHEGIVIGRLQNDGKLSYKQFNQYRIKYENLA